MLIEPTGERQRLIPGDAHNRVIRQHERISVFMRGLSELGIIAAFNRTLFPEAGISGFRPQFLYFVAIGLHKLVKLRLGDRVFGDPEIAVQGFVQNCLGAFSHPEGSARHQTKGHFLKCQHVGSRLSQDRQVAPGLRSFDGWKVREPDDLS